MSNASIQTDPNQLTKVPAQISIWDGKQWLEISNQQTINTINENVGIAQKTADGKNSITWDTDQPSTAIKGDIWLKKDADGNYSIQVYNGTDWDSPAEANIKAVKAQVSSLPQNYYQTDQPTGTDYNDGSHWYQQTGTDSNGNPVYTTYLWNSTTKTWDKMLNSGEVDNANQITQVKSDLSQAQSDITQAQSDIKTNASNLSSAKSELQSQVDTANSDITQAQSDITQAQSDIKTNVNAIRDNAGNISSLTSTASKLSSDMTNAQGDISTLQQSATGFKSDIADNKGNISILQTSVNGLSDTVSDNSGDISTLKNTTSGLSSTVATKANQSDLNTTNSNVSSLTNTVNGLNSTVADNKGNISSLTNTINGLSNTVADNKGNISTLQTRADSFDVSVGQLQTSAAGIQLLTGTSNYASGWSWDITPTIDTTQTPGVLHYPKTTITSGISTIAQQNIGTILQPSTVYTASFYAKGSGSFVFYCYPSVGLSAGDNRTVITLTSSYKLYTISFTTISSISGSKNFLLRNDYNSTGGTSNTVEAYVYGMKLEKGSLATSWCLSPMEQLTSTGNYAGLSINAKGLTEVAGSTTVYLSNTHGFEIQKSGSDIFHVDTSGNLTMQGNITAGNISGVDFQGDSLTLSGTLGVTGSISADNGNVVINSSGLTIKGAGLTIGDSNGKTTTYIRSDGTFVTNEGVFSGSANIIGGSLKVGSNFSVDTSGNLIASNAAITGTLYVNTSGNETWIDGNGIHNSDNSASDVYVKNGKITSTWTDGTSTTGSLSAATGEVSLQYGNAEIGMFNSRTNAPELYFSDASNNSASIAFEGKKLDLTSDGDINLSPSGALGLFGDYILMQSTGSVHIQSSSSYRVYLGRPGSEMSTDGGSLYNSSTSGWYMRDNSGNLTTVHGTSFVNSSLLSLKTNISKIDPATALDKINQTNFYDYQYKADVAKGSDKHYTSFIIDDVNDVSQYTEPSEFLSEDKKGRDDGTLLAYACLAIQELSKQIKDLENK